MPTYQEISNEIFNYFLALSYGSEHFIMHFDSAALNEVAIKLDISADNILESIIDFYRSNYYKKTEFSDPLSCFGIIGLQLHCASSMGLDFNHNQFNPILAQKLNRPIQSLQEIYIFSQDLIWQTAKYHISKTGFLSNIPQQTVGPGCYVQYPKSQSYFNHNDLKSFQYLFASHPQIFPCLEIGKISFFNILCKGNLAHKANAPLTPRAINLITDRSINQEILKSQIYNYYCSLDEFELVISDPFNPPKQSYKLFYDDTNGYYLFNGNSKIDCVEDSIKRLLNTYNIISGLTKFIILKRDPGYGDFYHVIKADLGDKVKILVFDFNDLINQCLPGYSPSISFQNHEIKIYDLIIPNEISDLSCLYTKIVNAKEETALSWLHGVKLDRNNYLNGYGPSYKANFKTRVYIDGRYHELNENEILDLSDLEIGFHTIHPVNGRKISFTILDALFTAPPLNSCTGWNLDTFNLSSSEFSVSGLKFHELNKIKSFSTRNFINLSLGKKVNNIPKNQLYNALSKIQ